MLIKMFDLNKLRLFERKDHLRKKKCMRDDNIITILKKNSEEISMTKCLGQKGGFLSIVV